MSYSPRKISQLATGRPAKETCSQRIELAQDCQNKWMIKFKYIRPSDQVVVEAHSDKEINMSNAIQTALNIIGVDGVITKWALYIVPQVRYTSPIARTNKWDSRTSRIAWDNKHDSFIKLCKTFGVTAAVNAYCSDHA